MRRLIVTLLILATGLFAINIHAVSAQPQYVLTDLGAGAAYGVNNNGQVAGNTVSGAILFDNTGQGNNINLGNGSARSINDSGQIVGTYVSSFSPSVTQAMNYKHNLDGTYTAEVMASGTASSVSNNGQMVGSSGGNAVIFTYNAGLNQYQTTSLGAGAALSNNDNSQIVGQLNSNHQAVLWNIYGGVMIVSVNLGTLTGYSRSEALSINSSGKIVGDAYNSTTDTYHAVFFDEGGGGQNIYLGLLSGYKSSKAFSINDSGQIVGTCLFTSDGLSGHATLFDPTGAGNNIDLNNCLVNPISGVILTGAMAINDNGWIVGTMDNGHAYLLTSVPEPCTLMLLGLGGLILRKRS